MEHFLSSETIGLMLLSIIKVYLLLTFVLTVVMLIHMYRTEYKVNDRRRGRNRILELASEGRWKQTPLYTMQEINRKHALAHPRLSVFPNDTGQRRKYAIICPGGGYAHLTTVQEAYPVAARLNEMGYTAFVLEYRTGVHCSEYAPMHDLARAVRYITDHAEEFNVEREDYAIIGFSAGGNLAGIYGTEEFGYEKYHTLKPGALLLAYPWTNVNHWLRHPYWNIWQGLMGIWFSERGNIFMFGVKNTRRNRESLCVQNWITEDYPPVYMFAGGQDIIVPANAHTDVLHRALQKYGVKHIYQKYFRIPHGIGLGVGSEAENWLDEAVTFWEEQTK
ncbi:MAG: alpha/beta hydrolase [Lachnospiraceae bacterium]|nr:alpha/beta hydrolase [Lachnospiraceae bacterium]